MAGFKHIRDQAIILQKSMGMSIDFDGNHIFFYDETNNIKKFRINEEGFNNNYLCNFILGGILCDPNNIEKIRKIDIFENVKLQSSIKEVKFKHIATGDFLDCLKSKNLNAVLDNVNKSDLYLHYSSLNILYWSIVDIIDSCDLGEDTEFVFIIKDALYTVCKNNVVEVQEILFENNFPDIKTENIASFLTLLLSLVKSSNIHRDMYSIIEKIFRTAIDDDNLVFVQDEDKHQLIKSFAIHYCSNVYMFSNSEHIFDNESDMENEINQLLIGSNEYRYSFEDSKDDQLIQVSDVLVGIIGRMKTYINSNDDEVIENNMQSLDEQQLNNIRSLQTLINRTLCYNEAFIQSIEPLSELRKMNIILNH